MLSGWENSAHWEKLAECGVWSVNTEGTKERLEEGPGLFSWLNLMVWAQKQGCFNNLVYHFICFLYPPTTYMLRKITNYKIKPLHEKLHLWYDSHLYCQLLRLVQGFQSCANGTLSSSKETQTQRKNAAKAEKCRRHMQYATPSWACLFFFAKGG